ncbi:MAG: PH domain-containing protein [Cytophagaceae bacterium]|nr:PH domain-containing protein [Cytophagaceae bacterium]
MDTIDHLNSRFKQIGYTPKSGAIAFTLLAQTLKKKEVVLYLLEGSIGNTIGYLIATDKRVFYAGIDKHKSPMLEHMNYSDIENIKSVTTRLPSVDILISSRKGKEFRIKGCEPKDGNKFVKLLRYLSEGSP